MILKKVISVFMLLSLFYSCSNSYLPISNSEGLEYSIPEDQVTDPFIVYDSSRDISVFIEEDETPIDLISYDEVSGRDIKCIDAADIVLFNKTSNIRSAGNGNDLRAVVVGYREDGFPGIWLIFNDGSVKSPVSERTGKRSSLLEDADEKRKDPIGGEIEGFLGWKYYPTIISEDGLMIGGYAFNEEGFSKHLINVEPESKAAVYWRLKKNNGGNHMISRARVVGVLPEKDGEQDWFIKLLRKVVSRLKLLFLSELDNYLVEPESIDYSEEDSLYMMTGPDRDGDPATAMFNFKGVYSIVKSSSENRAPYDIISPSEQTIIYDYGEIHRIQLLTSSPGDDLDPDGDVVSFYSNPPLEITDEANVQDGMTINNETGVISILNYGNFTADESITFWTEDEHGNKSAEFTLTIHFDTSS